MVSYSEIDDATVIDKLGLIGAEYVPIAGLTSEERSTLPQVWIDAAASDGAGAGRMLANAWRDTCPSLPLVAELVERTTRRVVVARLNRRVHWTKLASPDDGHVWQEFGLVYFLRSAFDEHRLNVWCGWRPCTPEWPAYSETVAELTGRLISELQNGFFENFASGLLPVEDWHAMSEMPEDSWAFMTPDGETLTTAQHPVLSETLIAAEDAGSWSHVVVAPKASSPLWAGFDDALTARTDLASEIETLVGTTWGGRDWHDKL